MKHFKNAKMETFPSKFNTLVLKNETLISNNIIEQDLVGF